MLQERKRNARFQVTFTVRIYAQSQSEALTVLESRVQLGAATDPHSAYIETSAVKTLPPE